MQTATQQQQTDAFPMAGTKAHSVDDDVCSRDKNDGDENATAQRAVPWKALFCFTTKANAPTLTVGIVSACVSGAISPAQSYLVGRIFDTFTSSASGAFPRDEILSHLRMPIIWLVVIGGGGWIFHSTAESAWIAFGELQAKAARDRLFRGLLFKDISWYDTRPQGVGAVLPRLYTQIRELQLATSQPMSMLVSTLSCAILSLVEALYFSWKLTLVTIASAPFILALVMWIGSGMAPHMQRQSDMLSEAQKYVNGAVTAIETVKCFNGQAFELRKYMSRIEESGKSYTRIANRSGLQMGLVSFLTIAMFIQGFYYGGVLIRNGEKTTADVITTFLAALEFFTSLQAILPQMIVLEQGRSASGSLQSIIAEIETTSAPEAQGGFHAPSSCRGDIQLTNVNFTYPSRPTQPALVDVNMHIPAGNMTFLIGKSGSGKSTLGQLLMRFYHVSTGAIVIDGLPLEQLDVAWLRSNVTLVEQTSTLFNETIFRNVAFGKRGLVSASQEEVAGAIDFALLQLVAIDLPYGLESMVGSKGSSMSGGQRQRVALARARLRDTPILILDESTSALDVISRTLIMDAIREWRKDRTTIVITHDISQIQDDDYAFVLENGRVVQEGYRKHTAQLSNSSFAKFHPRAGRVSPGANETTRLCSLDVSSTKPRSSSAVSRPNSESTVDPNEANANPSEIPNRTKNRLSSIQVWYQQGGPSLGMRMLNRPSTFLNQFASPPLRHPPDLNSVTVTAPPPKSPEGEPAHVPNMIDLVDRAGQAAADVRSTHRTRKHWEGLPVSNDDSHHHQNLNPTRGWRQMFGLACLPESRKQQDKLSTIKEILSTLWPNITLMERIYCILGFWGCTIHAVVTPVFSFLLSKLIGTYSNPQKMQHASLLYSMILVAVATVDATHFYLQRITLEYVGEQWVNHLRAKAMGRVLDQPKEFFEKNENSASRICRCLDRNAEEMRNILGRFAGVLFMAAVLICISLVWALIAQWKMTLIVLAVAPYFGAVSRAFAVISEKWEGKSNHAGEAAAEVFSEVFTNIRTVRALTLEDHFLQVYTAATQHVLATGLKRALYIGFFYGMADSASVFIMAMLFYVGGWVAEDGAKLSDVIQVFTMMLFTVSNLEAFMNFLPQIGSAKDAGARLILLSQLPKDSHEHTGDTRVVSNGEIRFNSLSFAYPTRPNMTVLARIDVHIVPGSCMAIVGGSGSGKSTIANLLLRLYSTSPGPGVSSHIGEIHFSGRDIRAINVHSLRSLITVVPQTPILFSATIKENIAYGSATENATHGPTDVRDAARRAGIHDFIVSLPQGYATVIGEGGTALSGGQAQRIVIARALFRKPAVLILDEATSALDIESADIVRETVQDLVRDSGRSLTVIIITHHQDMMAIAKQIVMLDQGRVVEEGPFNELVARNGALANLLSGGQWDEQDGK